MSDMQRYRPEMIGSVSFMAASDLGCWVRFDEAAARIAALEAELTSIDTALDSVTKCQAPTRADRITDSFLHTELVTDAAVFDSMKAEQSVRAQCTYWMQMVRAAGSSIAALEAENARLRAALERISANGCMDTYFRLTCPLRLPDAGSNWCAGFVAGKALEDVLTLEES